MATALSGRMAGHKGALTFVKHAGDSATEMSDHDIFEWHLNMRRQMADITAKDKSVKSFWYSHAEGVVAFKAYVNQGEGRDLIVRYHPGEFNQTELATITLWPDGDWTNPQQRWIMQGWIEEMRVEVSIGTPNIIVGKIRVSGDMYIEWPVS